MNREDFLLKLETEEVWDIVIIGGGATGLGAAVDAASRGYKTLLLEKFDFGKGTSSRSTKLVHGGVRYLAQGNIKLVVEALKERGRLLKNAAHITSVQSFVLPVYSFWDKWFYGLGLKLYEWLSGKWSLGKTTIHSKSETLKLLPSINNKNLKGSIQYFDGQFDDARLCIDLASTAVQHGAIVLNYIEVQQFIKNENKIVAIKAIDSIHQKEYTIHAKAFINATGVFSDELMKNDNSHHNNIITPSQGIHLVINPISFTGNHALLIPKTSDGRVLFAVPWHNKVIIGTTDTEIQEILNEPKALEQEINFVIENFNKYAKIPITKNEVESVFAGLRPLVKSKNKKNTAFISREHSIIISNSGLVTITGGKWTTYRVMAKDAIDNVIFIAGLNKKECITKNLKIGNWDLPVDSSNHLNIYGNYKAEIEKIKLENSDFQEKIHSDFSYINAEIIWFIRNEMAITLEDVLARRTRLLFLNSQISKDVSYKVVEIMAKELNKTEDWKKNQLDNFSKTLQSYL
jgi:glycerol-3-phosphate dehydrogenase